MLSAVHSKFGNPEEVLEAIERPMPAPGPGEIRVRMHFASIHNHDLLTVAGRYGYKPELPAIAGSEAMGVVDAIGENVSNLVIGQRVAASGLRGAWAEYFIVPAASAVPLPDQIDDKTAAQMLSMPLSALVLLDFAGIERGQWLLQNAANGAVAKVVSMIAATRGIHVVNLVRRKSSVEELRALGIDHVVSTDVPDWQDEVKSLVGDDRVAVAVDGVGGSSATELMQLLGENGLFISFGAMSGEPVRFSPSDLIFKQVTVKGFWLAQIMKTTPREKIAAWIGELVMLVSQGKVRLQTEAVFPLTQVAEAAKAAAGSARKGKVLLKGR